VFDTHSIECGAGIGRITEGLLRFVGKRVDLIEPTASFLDHVRNERSDLLAPTTTATGYIDRLICQPLEQFNPEPQRYDLIWCQWVLSHLTDDDFLLFMNRCAKALRPNGIMILKENVIHHGHAVDSPLPTAEDDYVVDEEDSSVTRSLRLWQHLIELAGGKVLLERWQSGFPKHLYPVRMWAVSFPSELHVADETDDVV
jgi:protein N-terminal methyltransferase